MAEHKVNSKATNKDARSSYASVNGLNLYYEISGTGEPSYRLMISDGYPNVTRSLE